MEIENLDLGNSEVCEAKTDTGGIYETLARHQQNCDWKHREISRELHRWAVIIDFEFKLEIPELSLRVDRLHFRRLGHFRYNHNGFGLRGEVAINDRYLRHGEFWDVIGTLAHELLHAWQQAHGKPGKNNYHNKKFREKARDIGLIVDEAGHTTYDPDGLFFALLDRHGVELPDLPEPVAAAPRRRGTSKMKLWTCDCTKVRVAIADFQALCLHCNRIFKRVG
jgi:hypothetical protein